MKRWRVVELQPGDLVPPRVSFGLVLATDDDHVAALVEQAAAAAGVILDPVPDPDDHEVTL